MISIKDWLDVVGYRITEGATWTWHCFGDNAHCLSSWNGDHNGSSFNIVFDTKTQEVYCVEAHDYAHDRAYRMIAPKYAKAFQLECKVNGSLDEAWEGVDYVNLDVEADWLEKARAIYNGEDYDTRVQLPVDFTDEELLTYMKAAHERDMTFNAFVEMALREAIARDVPTLTDTV